MRQFYGELDIITEIKKGRLRWLVHVERRSEERVVKKHSRRKEECRKTKVKVDGRPEGGPEEDGCHKLEDTCTQKRRLEDGREGSQGPTRTVEPWSSSRSFLQN